jgi:Photosynthetic reaction centre cytochrome C subunit
MIHYRKSGVALALAIFIFAGISATRPPDEHRHKNLKILPKNISDDDLDKIMDSFKDALGVKCNFCHAPSKDSTERKLDFASDEKPEKGIARHMMRMTNKINKKYFSFNKDEKGETVPAISCVTCHRGNPHPDGK